MTSLQVREVVDVGRGRLSGLQATLSRWKSLLGSVFFQRVPSTSYGLRDFLIRPVAETQRGG
jgi:hypothetical protein